MVKGIYFLALTLTFTKQAPGPLPSIRDRMTDPNDQNPLIAPASLI